MVPKNKLLRIVPEIISYTCSAALGSGGIYFAAQGNHKAAALGGIMAFGTLGAGYGYTQSRRTYERLEMMESNLKNRLIETRNDSEFQELFRIDYPAADF